MKQTRHQTGARPVPAGRPRETKTPVGFLTLLSTKSLYKTTSHWMRQGDCWPASPPQNVHRRKCGPHLVSTLMQRNDGRAPDEIRPINFELNVAPHASGSVLVSMGKTRVICAVTIEEAVP